VEKRRASSHNAATVTETWQSRSGTKFQTLQGIFQTATPILTDEPAVFLMSVGWLLMVQLA